MNALRQQDKANGRLSSRSSEPTGPKDNIMGLSTWFSDLTTGQKVAGAVALAALTGGAFGVSRLPDNGPFKSLTSLAFAAGPGASVKPVIAYASLAEKLDNPERIFAEAGYKPVFSVTKPES